LVIARPVALKGKDKHPFSDPERRAIQRERDARP
jgi:hypothetical protein